MANISELQHMIDLARAMWNDPHVICYQDMGSLPEGIPSIFLAGPTSREGVLEFKWRIFACHYLRKAGFTGIIVIPEARNNDWSSRSNLPPNIVAWEQERLLAVTLALVWLPRHQVQLPGRVTNTELAFLGGMAYADPDRFKERLVWGYPPNAWKVHSEHHWVCNTAGIDPFHDLEIMCVHAAERLSNLQT